MARKKIKLTASTDCKLRELGARIKRARLRRNISAEKLSEEAGIGESTFYAIERGASTVSIGAYAAVLFVLILFFYSDDDLKQITENRRK